jgi:hypothetical protein
MTPDLLYSSERLLEFKQLEMEKEALEYWKWSPLVRPRRLLAALFIFMIR